VRYVICSCFIFLVPIQGVETGILKIDSKKRHSKPRTRRSHHEPPKQSSKNISKANRCQHGPIMATPGTPPLPPRPPLRMSLGALCCIDSTRNAVTCRSVMSLFRAAFTSTAVFLPVFLPRAALSWQYSSTASFSLAETKIPSPLSSTWNCRRRPPLIFRVPLITLVGECFVGTSRCP
jgi:hypothetical protein